MLLHFCNRQQWRSWQELLGFFFLSFKWFYLQLPHFIPLPTKNVNQKKKCFFVLQTFIARSSLTKQCLNTGKATDYIKARRFLSVSAGIAYTIKLPSASNEGCNADLILGSKITIGFHYLQTGIFLSHYSFIGVQYLKCSDA